MKLRILEDVTKNKNSMYRGTDRTAPFYNDKLDENHKVNQAFLWYCAEGGEFGIVSDLTKAEDLVNLYYQLTPPQYFEVVELTEKNQPPVTKGVFLGFDLSAGFNYSLLSWKLEFDQYIPAGLPENDLFFTLKPLLYLIKDFFQPKLNENGLFNDYDTAAFCLECMMTLQKLRPGLWENEDIEFEIVGLWKVYPAK